MLYCAESMLEIMSTFVYLKSLLFVHGAQWVTINTGHCGSPHTQAIGSIMSIVGMTIAILLVGNLLDNVLQKSFTSMPLSLQKQHNLYESTLPLSERAHKACFGKLKFIAYQRKWRF